MTVTSRRKRPLNRTIPYLRDTRLIIIATEGKETEKQYFEDGVFQHPRVQIKVLPTGPDGRSAPQHVLSRLKGYVAEYDLQPDDQLWIVVDKDRWEDHVLADVCTKAVRSRRLKAQAAISNPSFEMWLYLHCAEWQGGVMTSPTLKKSLRDLLGSYNPSNIEMNHFRPGIPDAIRRAQSMDTTVGRSPWPDNPGTRVYRVVEAIQALRTTQQ